MSIEEKPNTTNDNGIKIKQEIFTIDGQQKALLQVLSKKDKRLGNIYFGALHVLNSNNPDKYTLAAHNIRELIEKITIYLDKPMERYDLKSHVNNFEREWLKIKKSEKWSKNSKWEGKIDTKLRKFLKEATKFFEKYNLNRPTREKRIYQLFKLINPYMNRLPKKIMQVKVEKLKTYWDFFNNCAHHSESKVDVFETYLSLFESFLLDKFKPRTFDTINKIDKIIAEGEQGD